MSATKQKLWCERCNGDHWRKDCPEIKSEALIRSSGLGSALCRTCGGRGLVPFKGKYVKTPVLCPDCKGNSGAWHVLISSWAGTVWHPVEVIRLSPSRSKVRFLDDNIKGKRGSVHTVPTGALRSPNNGGER